MRFDLLFVSMGGTDGSIELSDMRQRFEADKAKVAQQRAERKFRPYVRLCSLLLSAMADDPHRY